MHAWPPEYLFLVCCLIAGIGGVSRLWGSDKPLTLRNYGHAFFLHGCLGGGFAGVGYEYLGWKGKPLAMLGLSALYGGGVVSAKLLTTVVERLFGVSK